MLSEADDWLIKCCRVLKANVYGFLQQPGGEQDDKVPVLFSMCAMSVCFKQLCLPRSAFQTEAANPSGFSQLIVRHTLLNINRIASCVETEETCDCERGVMMHW